MLSKRLTLGAVLPLCVALITGCVAGQGAAAGDNPANGSPQAGLTPGGPSGTPSSSAAGAVASPSPALAPATLDVSPTDVRVGGVQMSLTFEPARHMFDQAAALLAEQSQQTQPTKSVMDATNSQGALVLADMLKVTNNIDPSQPLPADGVQSIIRHVAINVSTADNNQAVPYLGVTMDLLLDGHPVFFGQSVVPMVSSDANPPRVHYGNNIRLQQRGAYQVFIRMSRNPLLGQNPPQAAQFNVLVH